MAMDAMELKGRTLKGRLQRRFMDGVTEDMRSFSVTEEDLRDRVRLRQMIQEQLKKMKRTLYFGGC